MDDTIKNPQEMRRRMHEISVRDGRLEFPIEPSFVGVIVRNVLVTARLQGWGGEDTYTVLAWHLLQAAQRYGSAALEHVQIRPPAPVMVAAMPSWPIEKAPKDRPIQLLMPELFGVWAPGWWRGSWSHAKQAWAIHLPASIDGKAGMAELTEDAPQPTHWTELPPCP